MNLKSFIEYDKKLNKFISDKLECELYYHQYIIDDIINIWEKKCDIINIICDNINDIWGIKCEYKYYVLGDFLTNFITTNSINCFYNISRDMYLRKIMNNKFIHNFLNIDSLEYIKKHQKLLIGLRIDKVVERIIINNRDKNNEYVKIVMIKLNITKINKIYYDYSDSPYKIIFIDNIYYCIYSYRKHILFHHYNKNMVKNSYSIDSCNVANNICFIIKKDKFDKYVDYLNNLLNNELSNLGYSNYDDYINNNKINKKYDDLNNKIMLIYSCINIMIDKKLYFPSFIDNRGRQYYNGIISPTFNKYIRNIIEIDNNEYKCSNLVESRYYKELIKFKYCVENYNLDDINSYYLLLLFIELSKNYIKGEKNVYMYSINEFVVKGIYIYEHNTDLANIYIIYNIDNLIKNKCINKNFILYKDATASGLQNFGIIVGYNKETLKYINLEGNEWCDTYQYIINIFIDNDKYMYRNYWKKTIMTIPYNSSWLSCYKYYLDSINKNNVKFDKREMIDVHKHFYKNVKNKLKKIFYKSDNNTSKMIRFQYLKKILVKKYEYKIQYRGLRDKYLYNEYTYINDDYSTKKANEANNLHHLDSELVRYILKKYGIITIHDCYGIPIYMVHDVIDDINLYYSEHVEHEYSFFILK